MAKLSDFSGGGGRPDFRLGELREYKQDFFLDQEYPTFLDEDEKWIKADGQNLSQSAFSEFFADRGSVPPQTPNVDLSLTVPFSAEFDDSGFTDIAYDSDEDEYIILYEQYRILASPDLKTFTQRANLRENGQRLLNFGNGRMAVIKNQSSGYFSTTQDNFKTVYRNGADPGNNMDFNGEIDYQSDPIYVPEIGQHGAFLFPQYQGSQTSPPDIIQVEIDSSAYNVYGRHIYFDSSGKITEGQYSRIALNPNTSPSTIYMGVGSTGENTDEIFSFTSNDMQSVQNTNDNYQINDSNITNYQVDSQSEEIDSMGYDPVDDVLWVSSSDRNDDYASLARSDDGGSTFTIVESRGSNGDRGPNIFVDNNGVFLSVSDPNTPYFDTRISFNGSNNVKTINKDLKTENFNSEWPGRQVDAVEQEVSFDDDYEIKLINGRIINKQRLFEITDASESNDEVFITPITDDTFLSDIAYSENSGRYVAVGPKATIQYSDNLTDWTFVPQPIDRLFFTVEWVGDRFLAGTSNRIYESTDDGLTWSEVDNNEAYRIREIDGTIYICRNGKLEYTTNSDLTSLSEASFQPHTGNPSGNFNVQRLWDISKNNDGRYVVVGQTWRDDRNEDDVEEEIPFIAYSDNGTDFNVINWDQIDYNNSNFDQYEEPHAYGVTYNERTEEWTVVGAYELKMNSPNGINWEVESYETYSYNFHYYDVFFDGTTNIITATGSKYNSNNGNYYHDQIIVDDGDSDSNFDPRNQLQSNDGFGRVIQHPDKLRPIVVGRGIQTTDESFDPATEFQNINVPSEDSLYGGEVYVKVRS